MIAFFISIYGMVLCHFDLSVSHRPNHYSSPVVYTFDLDTEHS